VEKGLQELKIYLFIGIILFESELIKLSEPSDLYPNYKNYTENYCTLSKAEFRY